MKFDVEFDEEWVRREFLECRGDVQRFNAVHIYLHHFPGDEYQFDLMWGIMTDFTEEEYTMLIAFDEFVKSGNNLDELVEASREMVRSTFLIFEMRNL